jgi:hypothetical protein
VAEGVEVVGLAALAHDFARMPTDPAFRMALQLAGEKALAPVAAAARSAVPHVTGDLGGSIAVGHNKWGATLRMSSVYAGPVDFGGWPGGREYVASGRYLFPAAGGLSDKADTIYTASLQQALDAYRWTNTGDSPHD